MGGTLQSWYQSEHIQGPSWPVTPPIEIFNNMKIFVAIFFASWKKL